VIEQNSGFFFAKHLGREDRNDGVRVPPATVFESGFPTGVIEECFSIPAKFRSNLRQEEATCQPALQQNPIPPDDYLVEIYALEWRESGYFDVHVVYLFWLQWAKAGVLEGSGNCVVPDRSPQWRDADHVTDTPSKPTFDLESYKGTSRFEEFLVARLGRRQGFSVAAALDRFACQREQKTGRVPGDREVGGILSHLSQDGIVTT